MNEAQRKLAHLVVTNNYGSRMRAQQLDLIEQSDAELELAQVADVAQDFGRITAGRIEVADSAIVLDPDGIVLTDSNINDLKLFVMQVGALINDARAYFYYGSDNAVHFGFDGLADVSNNHIDNGDFELGSFAGWTTTGAGTWSYNTANPISGAHTANVALSGTGDHTLVSDIFSVMALTPYLLRFAVDRNGEPASVKIDWYTALVSGSLISTSTYALSSSEVPALFEKRVEAPAGAGAAIFTFTVHHSSGGNNPRIDNIQFLPFDVSGGVQFSDTARFDDMPIELTPYTLENYPAVRHPKANIIYTKESTGELVVMNKDAIEQRVLDHFEDYIAYSASIINNTLYRRTLAQDSPGTTGLVGRYIWGWHQTNGSQATNFTATPNIYLGSSTIFSPTALTLSANANRHSWAIYILSIQSANSGASQVCSLIEIYAVNQTTANAAAGVTANVKTYYSTASEDFTAGDIDVILRVAMSASNAQFSVNTFDAEGVGPWPGS